LLWEAEFLLEEGQKRGESMLQNHSEQIARLEGLGEGLGHSATQGEFNKLTEKMAEVQSKLEVPPPLLIALTHGGGCPCAPPIPATHLTWGRQGFGEIADGLSSLMDSIRADQEGIGERHTAEIQAAEMLRQEAVRDNENWSKMVKLRLEPLDEGDKKFRPLLLDLQMKIMESECNNALKSGTAGRVKQRLGAEFQGQSSSPKSSPPKFPGVGKPGTPRQFPGVGKR
jgi:hypothetical protein